MIHFNLILKKGSNVINFVDFINKDGKISIYKGLIKSVR